MKKSAQIGLLLLLAVILIVFMKDTGLPGGKDTPKNTVVAEESASQQIDVLTEQHRVVDYLHQHHKLPDYYITKKQARQLGWEPRKGNLCEVIPGKAIGGDRFTNREHKLPDEAGRQWFEADVNYNCGHRGSDRLIYSSDGLIYLTLDHYNNFTRLE
ncbi:ribonuclease domain-containing protein [Xenorhabdus innexi]|uniref:Ribonuclease n=1 Tax=Xenorhabdus innexi TaxID=290109 RepID=A0A1N6MQD4_9GAMM|nr:ribonuclease domain-containing protein [Xenorhabdus innexi]PHM36137.1 barnase [Xenorhabdus innexi]SIP71053.1 Ribonuclease [Xenorhabdus innexi]